MRWSDIPCHPSDQTLRQFAGLWIVFFSGLAAWQGLVRGHTLLGLVFAALVATVGPLGLVKPQAVRLLFVGWMILAFPIGWTVSTLVLIVLYYGLFTPTGLLLRLAGRDVLSLRRPDRPTYWLPKPSAPNVRAYFRQF